MKQPKNKVTSFCANLSLLMLGILSSEKGFLTAVHLNCADGFYNRNYNWLAKQSSTQARLELHSNSCLPCNCNRVGSLSSSCNKGNGNCYCVEGYLGFKCNKCARGYVDREDSGDSRKNSSTRCEKCGECFESGLSKLEELKATGIDLIRKVSDAIRSRIVTLNSPNGKLIQFLNSSRLEISENLGQRPVDLSELVEQLDTSFLETKEYSDKLSQMSTDLENFLTNGTHHSVGKDSNQYQIESLTSILSSMVDMVDGHIYSLACKKSSFERVRQKNDNLSPQHIIKNSSKRSCEMAVLVADMRQKFENSLPDHDWPHVQSQQHERANSDGLFMVHEAAVVGHDNPLHGEQSFNDAQLRLQKTIEELKGCLVTGREVRDKTDELLLGLETVAGGIPRKFRARLLKIFRESELISDELHRSLEVGRVLEQDFAKNAQSLSRQHENLMSLHKQMDAILQSLRYSQFRCDKLM